MKTNRFFYSADHSNCNDVDWYVVSGEVMNSTSLSAVQGECALKLLDLIADIVDNYEDTENGGAVRTIDWLDPGIVETFLVCTLSKSLAPCFVGSGCDHAKALLKKFESDLAVIPFLAQTIASSPLSAEGRAAEDKRREDSLSPRIYGWSYYHPEEHFNLED